MQRHRPPRRFTAICDDRGWEGQEDEAKQQEHKKADRVISKSSGRVYFDSLNEVNSLKKYTPIVARTQRRALSESALTMQ
jgi:hypothetical protein